MLNSPLVSKSLVDSRHHVQKGTAATISAREVQGNAEHQKKSEIMELIRSLQGWKLNLV